MWFGGEVGAVCFQHEAVSALGAECFANIGCIFVGYHSGKGGAATALVNLCDFCGAVGEAVKNDAAPVDVGLVDNADRVLEGITAVDNDWTV